MLADLGEVTTLMHDVGHGPYAKISRTVLEHIGRDIHAAHLMLSQRVNAMVDFLNSQVLAPKGSQHRVDTLLLHVDVGVVLGGPLRIDKVVERLAHRVKTVQIVEQIEDDEIPTPLVRGFWHRLVREEKSFLVGNSGHLIFWGGGGVQHLVSSKSCGSMDLQV